MSDNTPPPVDPPGPPPSSPYESGAMNPVQSGNDKAMIYGIIGIIVAVACCAPLGILFGYMSMQEARKQGKDETIGKVGFWLGIVFTALGVVGVILAVCLGGFGAVVDSGRN